MFNRSLNVYTFVSLFLFLSILFSSDTGFAAPVPEPEPKSVTKACVRVVIKTRIRLVINGTTSTSTSSRTSTRCVTKTVGVDRRAVANTDIPTIEVIEDA
ncbi:hypothetical protein TWF281_000476 [Arthrobotrys megalospora]